MSFVNTVDLIGDEALSNSIIDRSITEIADSHVTKLGESAFSQCISLVKANFQNVTSSSNNTFSGCKVLEEATFPMVTSVRNRVFEGCVRLKRVSIENATSIGNYAFSGCYELQRVDCPKVVKLNEKVFDTCRILDTVILRSETVAIFGTDAFRNTPIASGTGYIYVPAALVDSYKTATGWSTYANQIRAIEDYPEVCDPT
jgi:hypothetical protein